MKPRRTLRNVCSRYSRLSVWSLVLVAAWTRIIDTADHQVHCCKESCIGFLNGRCLENSESSANGEHIEHDTAHSLQKQSKCLFNLLSASCLPVIAKAFDMLWHSQCGTNLTLLFRQLALPIRGKAEALVVIYQHPLKIVLLSIA